eukprot:jgi/Mesvir1/25058/Mv11901-RA.1
MRLRTGGGGVWPDAQAVHMAQAASDKRARDRHRCVLPAALPARDAQRQSWLAQVAPLPRLRDVRARVMAACQALPKGAGGKRRQPGAVTPYPGFSSELIAPFTARVLLNCYPCILPDSGEASRIGSSSVLSWKYNRG